MQITEFRQKNPQYDDLEDFDLADKLYNKHYADMPRDKFMQDFGVEDSMPIKRMAVEAVKNIPSSGKQVISDMSQAVLHPINTAKSLYELAKGTIQLAIPGEQGSEEQARAVGRHYKKRYGSIEGVKQTFAKDPVGFMADLSVVLTGGGTAVAKGAQLGGKMSKAVVPASMAGATAQSGGLMQKVGQAGQAVAKAGNAIDPIVMAGKGLAKAGRGMGTGVAALEGALTGAGHVPVETAFKAGLKKGGSQDFVKNLKRSEDVDVVVREAADAVAEIADARHFEYVSELKHLESSTKTIPWDNFIKVFQEELKGMRDPRTGTFSKILPAEQAYVVSMQNMSSEVLQNKGLHDALGMDSFKQAIQKMDIPPQYKMANKMRTRLAKTIKAEIVAVVPQYKRMMKKYETSLNLEKDIRKTFSIDNRSATIDTTLRKLNTALRDNVTTGFGGREKLLGAFDKAGKIKDKLAGQALHDIMPRGIQKIAGPALAGAAGYINPVAGAVVLGAESPRLVGSLAYGAGRAASPVARAGKTLGPTGGRVVGQGLLQSGRIQGEKERKKKKKRN